MPAGEVKRRFGRWALVAGLPIGLVLSGGLIWQASQAAFTATTSNSANSFAAGTVTLADDDTGTYMFSVSGLEPGSTGQHCITVTYGGSIAAAVKLYVAAGGLTGTGLAAYLNLTIEEGAGGSFGSCAGFVSAATDFTGTMAAFATASTNSATGVGSFAPTGAAQSEVYRFTYTLADNNAAQGLNSLVTFTWGATST